MTQTPLTDIFVKQVRRYIYEHFVKYEQAPTTLQCAQAFSCPVSQIQSAFQQLAEGRALVLQHNGEILMAEPFSAVPTTFYVEIDKQAWWGNCIWDALGIPAMLKKDAHVVTACECCNDAMVVEIQDGKLGHPSGVVHFAIPPRNWWKNVVFA